MGVFCVAVGHLSLSCTIFYPTIYPENIAQFLIFYHILSDGMVQTIASLGSDFFFFDLRNDKKCAFTCMTYFYPISPSPSHFSTIQPLAAIEKTGHPC